MIYTKKKVKLIILIKKNYIYIKIKSISFFCVEIFFSCQKNLRNYQSEPKKEDIKEN